MCKTGFGGPTLLGRRSQKHILSTTTRTTATVVTTVKRSMSKKGTKARTKKRRHMNISKTWSLKVSRTKMSHRKKRKEDPQRWQEIEKGTGDIERDYRGTICWWTSIHENLMALV